MCVELLWVFSISKISAEAERFQCLAATKTLVLLQTLLSVPSSFPISSFTLPLD